MSYGLWVPFIWVAINISRSVGYWFVNGTEAAKSEVVDISQGSFIDRNTYLFLIIIGLLVLSQRRINWSSILASGRWLWIFYFYLLLSVLWSDYPFISFKRWFKDAGDLIMILIIVSEKDPIEAIRWIFVRCAYLLVPLSVLFIKWYPDIGRYYDHWIWTTCYCGITLGKNQLGLLCMLSGLFLLWQRDLRRVSGLFTPAGMVAFVALGLGWYAVAWVGWGHTFVEQHLIGRYVHNLAGGLASGGAYSRRPWYYHAFFYPQHLPAIVWPWSTTPCRRSRG
jgi:hypothetical protein